MASEDVISTTTTTTTTKTLISNNNNDGETTYTTVTTTEDTTTTSFENVDGGDLLLRKRKGFLAADASAADESSAVETNSSIGDSAVDLTVLEEEAERKKAMLAFGDHRITSAKTGWASVTPFRQLIFLFKLFFSRQFFLHRVVGLFFLIQYAASFYLYFFNYPVFKTSFLVWSLPLTGIFQSVNAIYTFTFLPKKQKDGGYFGDKSIMSYPFIIENSFYALILFYQWVYYDDFLGPLLTQTVLFEQTFVFFPYVIRTQWPKTSFRDAIGNDRNRTKTVDIFFRVAILVTKAFYVWAKHYIGYFLNYARFLNRIDNNERYYIHHILVFASFATTISVFLQTLKFKRYIGARTSFIIYFCSYMGTFYGFIAAYPIFARNLDLVMLTFIGLMLNFRQWEIQWGYQIAVCMLLNAARSGIVGDMGKFGMFFKGEKSFLYVGDGFITFPLNSTKTFSHLI